MLTAAEARKLAGPTLQEKIDSLLESVRAAAQKGNRCLKTGWEHQQDKDLWCNGGENNTKEWREAKAIL